MFLVFQNMGMHAKYVFQWQKLKKYYNILKYTNRQLAAKAAILNIFPPTGIVADFAPAC